MKKGGEREWSKSKSNIFQLVFIIAVPPFLVLLHDDSRGLNL